MLRKKGRAEKVHETEKNMITHFELNTLHLHDMSKIVFDEMLEFVKSPTDIKTGPA